MYRIRPLKKIRREIAIPSDKSISHRVLLIAALAKGTTLVRNFLHSNDTLATLACIKKLHIDAAYKRENREVNIVAGGPFFEVAKKVNLAAGESGTTMRLLSGILVGQKFSSVLHASKTLIRRPMKRITSPLRLMNADIRARKYKGEEYPPLSIHPVDTLQGITYSLPQASAQVKSAILFASLFSGGVTKIKEPYPCRDHTEKMLQFFGAPVKRQAGYILSEKALLKGGKEIFVPGDFSSASFFLALGVLLRDSELILKDVGLNPTRTGFLKMLKAMGANIRIIHRKHYFEPYADICVRSSNLKGIKVGEKEIPMMIDEIPILMVCASFARGTTEIYGLRELRVKETDRIQSMLWNLKRAGVDIQTKSYDKKKNWMVKIKGARKLKPASFKSFSDHRTAMSLIIFGLVSENICSLDEIRSIRKSFPDFITRVESLYG